jgi:hypothetical protein
MQIGEEVGKSLVVEQGGPRREFLGSIDYKLVKVPKRD